MKKSWSIVVCTYNGASRLKKVLNCINSAALKCENYFFQVIVVDNNSSDDCKIKFDEWVCGGFGNNCSYEYVFEENQGLMFARICGVNKAIGDYVTFIDDDNYVRSEFFFDVENEIKKYKNIGFIGVSTEIFINPSKLEFPHKYLACYAVGSISKKNGLLRPDETVWGAGMTVNSKVIKNLFFNLDIKPVLSGRCGSFSLAGDDSEICHLISLMGFNGYLINKVLLDHDVSHDRLSCSKLMSMMNGFHVAGVVLDYYKLNIKSRKTIGFYYGIICVLFGNFMRDVMIGVKYLLRCLFKKQDANFDFNVRVKTLIYKWSMLKNIYFLIRGAKINIAKINIAK